MHIPFEQLPPEKQSEIIKLTEDELEQEYMSYPASELVAAHNEGFFDPETDYLKIAQADELWGVPSVGMTPVPLFSNFTTPLEESFRDRRTEMILDKLEDWMSALLEEQSETWWDTGLYRLFLPLAEKLVKAHVMDVIKQRDKEAAEAEAGV